MWGCREAFQEQSWVLFDENWGKNMHSILTKPEYEDQEWWDKLGPTRGGGKKGWNPEDTQKCVEKQEEGSRTLAT